MSRHPSALQLAAALLGAGLEVALKADGPAEVDANGEFVEADRWHTG
jgi:hypothetical protein